MTSNSRVLRTRAGIGGVGGSGGVLHLDMTGEAERYDTIGVVKSIPDNPVGLVTKFIGFDDLKGATFVLTGHSSSIASNLRFIIYTDPILGNESWGDIKSITEKDYGDEGIDFLIKNYTNKPIERFSIADDDDDDGTFTFTTMNPLPEHIPIGGIAHVHISYDDTATPPEQMEVRLLSNYQDDGGVVHLDVGTQFTTGIDIVKDIPSEPYDYQAFITIGDLVGSTLIITGENTNTFARTSLGLTLYENQHNESEFGANSYNDIGNITEHDYGTDGVEFIIQNHSNKPIGTYEIVTQETDTSQASGFIYTEFNPQPDEIPVDGTALVKLSYDDTATPPEQVEVILLTSDVSGGGIRHLDVGGSTGVGIIAVKKYTDNTLIELQRPIAFDDLDGGTLIITGTNETSGMPELVFSVLGQEDLRTSVNSPTEYVGHGNISESEYGDGIAFVIGNYSNKPIDSWQYVSYDADTPNVDHDIIATPPLAIEPNATALVLMSYNGSLDPPLEVTTIILSDGEAGKRLGLEELGSENFTLGTAGQLQISSNPILIPSADEYPYVFVDWGAYDGRLTDMRFIKTTLLHNGTGGIDDAEDGDSVDLEGAGRNAVTLNDYLHGNGDAYLGRTSDGELLAGATNTDYDPTPLTLYGVKPTADGLTQTEVDARILPTARTGNTDRWAKNKLPSDTSYTEPATTAESGNTDRWAKNKLPTDTAYDADVAAAIATHTAISNAHHEPGSGSGGTSIYKGDWDTDASYSEGDIVQQASAMWICTSDVSASASSPDTEGSSWYQIGPSSHYEGGWSDGTAYRAGTIIVDDEVAYLVLQYHTSTTTRPELDTDNYLALGGGGSGGGSGTDTTVWRGTFDTDTAYSAGDIVEDSLSYWIANLDVEASETYPTDASSVWSKISTGFKGDWATSESYVIGDIVEYSGIGYLVKNTISSSTTPDADTTNYLALGGGSGGGSGVPSQGQIQALPDGGTPSQWDSLIMRDVRSPATDSVVQELHFDSFRGGTPPAIGTSGATGNSYRYSGEQHTHAFIPRSALTALTARADGDGVLVYDSSDSENVKVIPVSVLISGLGGSGTSFSISALTSRTALHLNDQIAFADNSRSDTDQKITLASFTYQSDPEDIGLTAASGGSPKPARGNHRHKYIALSTLTALTARSDSDSIMVYDNSDSDVLKSLPISALIDGLSGGGGGNEDAANNLAFVNMESNRTLSIRDADESFGEPHAPIGTLHDRIVVLTGNANGALTVEISIDSGTDRFDGTAFVLVNATNQPITDVLYSIQSGGVEHSIFLDTIPAGSVSYWEFTQESATEIGVNIHYTLATTAADVATAVANFDAILGSTDDDVQTALETLDDHDHVTARDAAIAAHLAATNHQASGVIGSNPTFVEYVIPNDTLLATSGGTWRNVGSGATDLPAYTNGQIVNNNNDDVSRTSELITLKPGHWMVTVSIPDDGIAVAGNVRKTVGFRLRNSANNANVHNTPMTIYHRGINTSIRNVTFGMMELYLTTETSFRLQAGAIFAESTDRLVSDGPGYIRFTKLVVGATGAQGPAGPAGTPGANGADGSDGAAGNDGAVGPAGPQGPAGSDGATGPAGPTGPQGPQGEQGETGPQGPQGPEGPAGTGSGGTDDQTAAEVPVTTTDFGGILSATEDDVQAALDIIDDHDHATARTAAIQEHLTAANHQASGAIGSDPVSVEYVIPDNTIIASDTGTWWNIGANTSTSPAYTNGDIVNNAGGDVTRVNDLITLQPGFWQIVAYIPDDSVAADANNNSRKTVGFRLRNAGNTANIHDETLTVYHRGSGAANISNVTFGFMQLYLTTATTMRLQAGARYAQTSDVMRSDGAGSVRFTKLVVGATGEMGSMGPAGADGAAGARGPAGNDGAMGPEGPQGPAGADGTNGADGNDGATGPQGPQGVQGETGPAGPTGPQGPEGPAGTGGGGDDQTAAEVPVTTTNFNDILSSNEDDVQAALDILDDHGHTSDISTAVQNHLTNANHQASGVIGSDPVSVEYTIASSTILASSTDTWRTMPLADGESINNAGGDVARNSNVVTLQPGMWDIVASVPDNGVAGTNANARKTTAFRLRNTAGNANIHDPAGSTYHRGYSGTSAKMSNVTLGVMRLYLSTATSFIVQMGAITAQSSDQLTSNGVGSVRFTKLVVGATGPTGPAGSDGATGPAGPAGTDGVDGVSNSETLDLVRLTNGGVVETISGTSVRGYTISEDSHAGKLLIPRNETAQGHVRITMPDVSGFSRADGWFCNLFIPSSDNFVQLQGAELVSPDHTLRMTSEYVDNLANDEQTVYLGATRESAYGLVAQIYKYDNYWYVSAPYRISESDNNTMQGVDETIERIFHDPLADQDIRKPLADTWITFEGYFPSAATYSLYLDTTADSQGTKISEAVITEGGIKRLRFALEVSDFSGKTNGQDVVYSIWRSGIKIHQDSFRYLSTATTLQSVVGRYSPIRNLSYFSNQAKTITDDNVYYNLFTDYTLPLVGEVIIQLRTKNAANAARGGVQIRTFAEDIIQLGSTTSGHNIHTRLGTPERNVVTGWGFSFPLGAFDNYVSADGDKTVSLYVAQTSANKLLLASDTEGLTWSNTYIYQLI